MNKVHMGVPLVMERLIFPTITEMLDGVELETIRWIAELNRFTDFGPLPLDEKEIYEVMVTHQVSHLRDRNRIAESGSYANLRDSFPAMRSDLVERGFEEPSGYFVVFCLVPVVIIHHAAIKEPPRSWKELAEPQWKGRVITFDMTVIHRLLGIGMKEIIGDRTEEFMESIGFHGAPINVNHEVDSGQADVAIMPLPFARTSRQGNVRMLWPEDGAFVVPNVITFKKNPDQRAIDIGKYLLSDKVQRMMNSLGLIPVNPNADLPVQVTENNLNLRWHNWSEFIKALNSD